MSQGLCFVFVFSNSLCFLPSNVLHVGPYFNGSIVPVSFITHHKFPF